MFYCYCWFLLVYVGGVKLLPLKGVCRGCVDASETLEVLHSFTTNADLDQPSFYFIRSLLNFVPDEELCDSLLDKEAHKTEEAGPSLTLMALHNYWDSCQSIAKKRKVDDYFMRYFEEIYASLNDNKLLGLRDKDLFQVAITLESFIALGRAGQIVPLPTTPNALHIILKQIYATINPHNGMLSYHRDNTSRNSLDLPAFSSYRSALAWRIIAGVEFSIKSEISSSDQIAIFDCFLLFQQNVDYSFIPKVSYLGTSALILESFLKLMPSPLKKSITRFNHESVSIVSYLLNFLPEILRKGNYLDAALALSALRTTPDFQSVFAVSHLDLQSNSLFVAICPVFDVENPVEIVSVHFGGLKAAKLSRTGDCTHATTTDAEVVRFASSGGMVSVVISIGTDSITVRRTIQDRSVVEPLPLIHPGIQRLTFSVVESTTGSVQTLLELSDYWKRLVPGRFLSSFDPTTSSYLFFQFLVEDTATGMPVDPSHAAFFMQIEHYKRAYSLTLLKGQQWVLDKQPNGLYSILIPTHNHAQWFLGIGGIAQTPFDNVYIENPVMNFEALPGQFRCGVFFAGSNIKTEMIFLPTLNVSKLSASCVTYDSEKHGSLCLLPNEVVYHPKELKYHTFQLEPPAVPSLVVWVFVALMFLPFFLLQYFWSGLDVNLSEMLETPRITGLLVNLVFVILLLCTTCSFIDTWWHGRMSALVAFYILTLLVGRKALIQRRTNRCPDERSIMNYLEFHEDDYSNPNDLTHT